MYVLYVVVSCLDEEHSEVRFGVGEQWKELFLSGEFTIGIDVFGDPAPGLVKTAEKRAAPLPSVGCVLGVRTLGTGPWVAGGGASREMILWGGKGVRPPKTLVNKRWK
jgi:hypothetical protein